MVVFNEEEVLVHYGILRKSGRYPWGSGGNVPQRSRKFLDTIEELKRQGMTESQIAKGTGLSWEAHPIPAIDFRALKTLATNAWRAAQIAWATRLRDHGHSPKAIAEKMDIPQSTVRSYLKPGAADKANKLFETAEALRREVDSKDLLDVGKGVENHMKISKERKDVAIAMLKEEGYNLYTIYEPQIGTGKDTTLKVLAKPDVTWKEAFDRRGELTRPGARSTDYGETWTKLQPPIGVNQKRVEINYAEDGGTSLDGVIYLRPGVKDLSMRDNNYAQVRIQVGNSHFIKGMAVYKDDLPPGVDIVFNTNKSKKGVESKLDVLKPLKEDADNPFGATVDQVLDPKTGKVTSAVNLVNEQGSWTDWSNTIASQVLSKQPPKLAKQQLNMTYERRLNEYEEIMALTNPAVRRKLLQEFAESTDAAAVHLKAAALPGQRWHVILPIDSLKDTEVYAPNYDDGTEVALIRYPHGGVFEIPVVTVNNKNRDASKIIGNTAQDAIGINSKVAQQLSGADFDGDTVLLIPNPSKQLRTSRPLKELEGFDPTNTYPKYEGMKVMSEQRKQREMGDISNLITDMTIKLAPPHEIARAVKHSMVVIDAAKHELNYKQSAIDNNIAALKTKYQKGPRSGADTLISLATSESRVPVRKDRRSKEGGPIDPDTGKKVYTYTGETYVDKNGKTVLRTFKSTKLAEADDAYTLSSGTPMEAIYADHSNRLKALANESRRSLLKTPRAQTSASAKKVYAKEVDELKDALDIALMNAPLERQAQLLANAAIRQKKDAKPNMDGDEEKKLRYQALETYRNRLGAGKTRIEFTPRQWEAIQAGAISDSMLSQMLNNADMENVRSLATPQTRQKMTSSKMNRAQGMLDSGYTRAQVASQLGVSISTLDRSLSGE